MTRSCPRIEPPTAYKNIRFVKKPIWKIDLLWGHTEKGRGAVSYSYNRKWKAGRTG